MMTVKDRRWWVIGLARSGCAAGALLRRHGGHVIGIDDHDEESVRRRWERDSLTNLAPRAFDELATGGSWPQDLPDGVVISPGVPPHHPRLQALPADVPILGELELGAAFCRADLVAVTGTNGKSTTTEWVAHLLRATGRRTEALGNLGTPLSQVVDELEPGDAVSLEVSSFQLETVDLFRPRVGMVLNLAPDHLDRYPDLGSYFAAKRTMSDKVDPAGHFITWTRCPEARAWPSPAQKLLFGDEADGAVAYFRDGALWIRRDKDEIRLLEQDEVALPSPPNLLNALATAAVGVAMDASPEAMAAALREFSGLKHRQELVAVRGALRFINDTKATNVHSVCAALNGYQRPVALILGGSGKGESYRPLTEVLEAVVEVVTIGQEGPAIAQILAGRVPERGAQDLQEAVRMAAEALETRVERGELEGGDVMLSPACASYDMFTSYRQRGEEFLEAALAIGARKVEGS